MNWGTLTAELMIDGQKPDTTREAPRVQRQICDSIAIHNRERLFFMEKRGSVTLVSGQDSYTLGTTANTLPKDLLSISGQTIDLDIGGDANQRWFVRWKPAEAIDDLRRRQAFSGQPDFFGFYGNSLELWPKPSANGDVLRFRYVVAPGIPIKRFETSTWVFYKPFTTSFVSGNQMVDAYPNPSLGEVNPWFDTTLGYNVIRHHALFALWSGPWRGSSDQAQQQQVMYLEALTALKEWSERKVAPRQVQPYMLEEDAGNGPW